jgi:hypothetical protein
MSILDKIAATKSIKTRLIPMICLNNPKGVAAQSPRLRGTRYLGKGIGNFNNLEEVVALNVEHGRNLFEVGNTPVRLPRVVPLRDTTLGFETKPLRGFLIFPEFLINPIPT